MKPFDALLITIMFILLSVLMMAIGKDLSLQIDTVIEQCLLASWDESDAST